MNKTEALELADEFWLDPDFSTHLKDAVIKTKQGEYDPSTGLRTDGNDLNWTGFIFPRKNGNANPLTAHLSSDEYDGEYMFMGKTVDKPEGISKEQTIEVGDICYRILSIQSVFDVIEYLYLDVI